MLGLAGSCAVTAALCHVEMASSCGPPRVRVGLFGMDRVGGSDLAIRLIRRAERIRRCVDR